ncbi:4Fe-4S binding protein [Colibacter massiliensis]
MNGGGYHYTCIDDTACIGCGTCYIVCPDGVYEVLGS